MSQEVENQGSDGESETLPQPPPQAAAGHGSPPLVHIHFYDNDHSQGIYQLIEAYMLSVQAGPLAEDLKQQVSAVSRDMDDGGSDEKTLPPETTSTHTEEEEAMEEGGGEEVEEATGQVQYYMEYCVDKYPMTYKTEVLFQQVYMDPFWIDPFVAREEKRLRKMAIKCFNCGDDHHINQCPEPRDPLRISNESKLYREALGPVGADKRYHLANNNNRFSKFTPGHLSARLRQALGIGPSGIPPYISRMHLLGYPPGYKIQAEEQGLLLYHDPNTGEATKQNNKVIIFPGFNDVVANQQEPAIALAKSNAKVAEESEDDLGTLSDYELEEMDGDDGEKMIGFCTKKTSQREAEISNQSCDNESTVANAIKKSFSLDFPPGMVDIDAKSEPSSERWNVLKKILSHKT